MIWVAHLKNFHKIILPIKLSSTDLFDTFTSEKQLFVKKKDWLQPKISFQSPSSPQGNRVGSRLENTHRLCKSHSYFPYKQGLICVSF